MQPERRTRMSFFRNLIGKSPPHISRVNLQDPQKCVGFLAWFMRNDPLVRIIAAPGPNAIFQEGFRPPAHEQHTDALLSSVDLADWFGRMMYINFQLVSSMTKQEFVVFIDDLDSAGRQTLIMAGTLAGAFGLRLDQFIYNREILKIPEGAQRDAFKQNYLSDCVLGAEIRALTWLYHEWFGEWYQIKERREG